MTLTRTEGEEVAHISQNALYYFDAGKLKNKHTKRYLSPYKSKYFTLQSKENMNIFSHRYHMYSFVFTTSEYILISINK